MQQPVTNETQYPLDAVVFLSTTFPDGQVATGSGVMVGPNDVLTASHMVYSSAHGGAAAEVTVTPAYDPSAQSAPFGTVDAVSWHYTTDFDPDGDGFIAAGSGGPGLEGTEEDVALLDLDVPLGNQTGWMGIDPNFTEGEVNVTGYPAIYGSHMMNDTGTVLRNSVDWFLDTQNLEIHPGNSGGPLWYLDQNGAPEVVGIVSTAVAAYDVAALYDTTLDWIAGNDSLIA
jgi:V8-like Glu-specific endopeptidase